jgi:hypothetical protein
MGGHKPADASSDEARTGATEARRTGLRVASVSRPKRRRASSCAPDRDKPACAIADANAARAEL